MFLTAVTGIASTLQNVIIGTSSYMVIATLLCTVGGVVGYLAARRTRRPYPLKMALFVFFLALLVFSWITQAGSQGTVGYYFVLLGCYAVVLFGGASKIITLALTASTLGAMLVLEHHAPSLILPHTTRLERFADVALALPLCLAMAVAVIHLIYREYQRERRAKDRVLDMVTTEKNRVEQAMREKQRLLSVVSHDIANALQVLQAELDIAHLPPRAGHPPPAADLDQMAYACTKIEEIIGSVRMMEGLERQQLSLQSQPVDLSAMFEYAQVIFGKRLSRRHMRFEFPQVGNGTRFVMAEPRILANQVFGNLISNAIKFSYPSSTIAFSVTREAERTTIRVSDRGVGIPPDLMADIFNTQTNATRKGTEGERGTGLGLRTVKHFVDLFGGQLEISTRPEQDYPDDHGTTVAIHLKSAATPAS
jgi:signal transduction histidine kinase